MAWHELLTWDLAQRSTEQPCCCVAQLASDLSMAVGSARLVGANVLRWQQHGFLTAEVDARLCVLLAVIDAVLFVWVLVGFASGGELHPVSCAVVWDLRVLG